MARKRQIELPDIAVRVVGTYDGPKFAHVRVEVTSSHARDELEALAQHASRVCYVSNTIRALDDTEVVIT